MASDKGAGHPRPDGKAEKELIVELSATTTTQPAGMRGHASRAAIIQGSPRPGRGGQDQLAGADRVRLAAGGLRHRADQRPGGGDLAVPHLTLPGPGQRHR